MRADEARLHLLRKLLLRPVFELVGQQSTGLLELIFRASIRSKKEDADIRQRLLFWSG